MRLFVLNDRLCLKFGPTQSLDPTSCKLQLTVIVASGGSKNFEGGRQFISPVLIYRKCTQRSVGLLQEKGGFL